MDKEYLIKKWLNDELTDVERKTFEDLDDYELNANILDSAKYFKASNFSNTKDFDSFKREYDSNKVPVKQLNWLKPVIRVAAALILGFGIYFFGFYSKLSTYETLVNQKISIELPDHSKVKLNALSQIEFKKANWQDNREVKLKGEAYFIVEKGSNFNVVTNTGLVTVVGTEFNVMQRKNYFEVKCFEGIVKVNSNSIERILYAGDSFQIINGIFEAEKISSKEPKWIRGVSSFNEVPFKMVIDELKRQYNVNISFKNVSLSRQFSGGFKHNNLEKALIAITKPMSLTYKFSSLNDVVIYGDKN